MDKASDYESGDSRFESWQDRKFWPTNDEHQNAKNDVKMAYKRRYKLTAHISDLDRE